MLITVKPSLHWQSLARYCSRLHPQYHAVYTYLGRRVTQGGQGKYSHLSLSLMVSLTNVANVNDPLVHILAAETAAQ